VAAQGGAAISAVTLTKMTVSGLVANLRTIARGFSWERVSTAQARSAAPTISAAADEIERLHGRLAEVDRIILMLTMDHNSSPNYLRGFDMARKYYGRHYEA
jgi:hypothetical protein